MLVRCAGSRSLEHQVHLKRGDHTLFHFAIFVPEAYYTLPGFVLSSNQMM